MKKFISEFKEFISRGNVMDMAVGIIIGSAFTAIVTSLVEDILMPVISRITGGISFDSWKLVLGSGENAPIINFGSFVSAIINFLLIALVLFLMIRAINRLHKTEEAAPTTKTCPYCKSEVDINATRCPHCTSELTQ